MIDKRLERKINFIEIYQIIGGLVGILFMSYMFVTSKMSGITNWFDYISMFTPFLFFGFCIYSGILLNKKNYV